MSDQMGGLQYQEGGVSRRQGWATRPRVARAPVALGRLLESKVLPSGLRVDIHEMTKKDGSKGKKSVFRGFSAPGQGAAAAAKARAARANLINKPITAEQAKKAFDSYYARTRAVTRGQDKGMPVFKSPRGRRAARTYDVNHTGKKVIATARYLKNPRGYDFEGVDTGAKVRKALTQKQATNLAAGRAKRTAARVQAGGYWW